MAAAVASLEAKIEEAVRRDKDEEEEDKLETRTEAEATAEEAQNMPPEVDSEPSPVPSPRGFHGSQRVSSDSSEEEFGS